MPRKKTILLLLLFILGTSHAISQKIFRDGFIVKNSGEYFEGVVAFNQGNKVPSKCVFKRFDIAVEINYGPDDISGFGFTNGKRYVSINNNGRKEFFETVITGDLTLYSKGSEFFLSKPGKKPVRVTKGPIEWEDEDGSRTYASPAELISHLAEGTKAEISKKPDLKKDLQQVIIARSLVSGKPVHVYSQEVTEKELTTQAWHSGANSRKLGIVAGFNMYSLHLSAKMQVFVPETVRETGPMLGISYEKILSRRSDNFCFHAELLFLRQTFYSYSEKTELSKFIKDDAFYEFTALKVPLMFQYSLGGMRVVPFVNGGVGAMVFLQDNYLHIREFEYTSYGGAAIYISEDRNLAFAPAEFSGIVGAGIKLRLINTINLRIEGRFEYGLGPLTNENSVLEQSSMQPSVLLGISF
jgi:hypothetical protein